MVLLVGAEKKIDPSNEIIEYGALYGGYRFNIDKHFLLEVQVNILIALIPSPVVLKVALEKQNLLNISVGYRF